MRGVVRYFFNDNCKVEGELARVDGDDFDGSGSVEGTEWALSVQGRLTEVRSTAPSAIAAAIMRKSASTGRYPDADGQHVAFVRAGKPEEQRPKRRLT